MVQAHGRSRFSARTKLDGTRRKLRGQFRRTAHKWSSGDAPPPSHIECVLNIQKIIRTMSSATVAS